MDPRFDNDAQTTGTLAGYRRGRAQPVGGSSRPEPPAWLEETRAGLAGPGRYLAFEQDGRVVVVPGQPGMDADRPLAGRRHPLRRRHGLAPSCADRQRGGRRTRARRPLAQRHPGQRPARRVEPAGRRRRARRSAATRCTSWTPCPRRTRRRPAALTRVALDIVRPQWPTRSRSCRSRAARARPRPSAPWPTCSGASAWTCWPSTSTRRATCRTTSTSRRTPRRAIADVLSGDAKVKDATYDGGIVPATLEPRRGRARAERARWAARSCSRRRSRTPASSTT